jgi:ferredoxin-NADP reductase
MKTLLQDESLLHSVGPANKNAAVPDVLTLRLTAIHFAAQDINVYEFGSPDGTPLPSFDAGAHVDIFLANGMIRQYSLCNDPIERNRYEVAVLRQPEGRGGSVALHDGLRCGDLARVSVPRNHFRLDLGATSHTLIAGGIGITPIMAMVYALEHIGARYTLHYCARSAERMAFRQRLEHIVRSGRVHYYVDEGPQQSALDVSWLLAEQTPGEHVYCCGPQGLIDAVTVAMNGWPAASLHVERFGAPTPSTPAQTAGNDEFLVELASTGQTILVRADISIAAALQQHGINIPTSCEQGVCGTCQVGYLDGVPDHRDLILLDDERKRYLMACCSRSLSKHLVLDL